MVFQTTDDAASGLRPVRVAALPAGVVEEARNLASELPGWRVLRADEVQASADGFAGETIHCERVNTFPFGRTRVTIRVEAPPGIPSTTVTLRCESNGAWISRDRAVAAEFLRPFVRRVCL